MMRLACQPVAQHRGQTSPARRGFTLVELLVTMGIFAILAGIAITSFRATSDDDRIAACAQQIKSSVNGAQSRALRDRGVRGIRFVRDPQNPTLCTALQYIGETANDTGFVDASLGINKSVTYFSRFDADGNAFDFPDGDAATPMFVNCVVPVNGTTGGLTEAAAAWRQLINNNTIQTGVLASPFRIRLGGASGDWYTVLEVRLMNPAAPVASQFYGLRLAEPYAADAGTIATISFNANLEYSLETGYGPLADEPPIALPKGTVIDLDGSDIPPSWRPTDTNASSTITFASPAEYPNCDLMFSSNGKIIGTLASSGILHFYIGNLEEIDRYNQARFDASTLAAIRPRLGTEAADVPGDDTSTAADETQKKPARWVTLLTASGQMFSSEVDRTVLPGTPTFAQIASQRLRFAKRGEEAGR